MADAARAAARDASEDLVRRIPRRRKIVYLCTIWLGLFLVAEIGARVGGFFLYGRSPFFLFYGLKSFMADGDPEGHSAAFDGYFKFPPSRTLQQYGLFTQRTPIRINAHGFRGPDFSVSKPDSVRRIICLGESSTFGFFNTDAGTYPAILGRLLNEAAAQPRRQRYEVINAGIPHANSDNIRAMVEGEILTYEPDVLTLYAGYNDAAALMSPSTLHRLMTWLHGHFASYVAFKQLLLKLGGPELPSRWSTQVAGSDSSRVNKQIALHNERYRANLERIVAAAQRHGIQLILMKQPMTLQWGDTTGLTYQQKVERARGTLSAGGRISGPEATLVVHAALMEILDGIAAHHRLPVVDNIAIVDRHPEYFASYVHLTETANRSLAEAIQAVLEPARVAKRAG